MGSISCFLRYQFVGVSSALSSDACSLTFWFWSLLLLFFVHRCSYELSSVKSSHSKHARDKVRTSISMAYHLVSAHFGIGCRRNGREHCFDGCYSVVVLTGSPRQQKATRKDSCCSFGSCSCSCSCSCSRSCFCSCSCSCFEMCCTDKAHSHDCQLWDDCRMTSCAECVAVVFVATINCTGIVTEKAHA